jgi:hypothetical protein
MVKILSDTALSTFRNYVNANLLPDTCNILEEQRTSDGMGGWSTAWGTAGTAVLCRVDPYTADLDRDGGRSLREGGATYFILTLPHDQSVAQANQIEYDGTRYEIMRLFGEHSRRAVKRLVISRID